MGRGTWGRGRHLAVPLFTGDCAGAGGLADAARSCGAIASDLYGYAQSDSTRNANPNADAYVNLNSHSNQHYRSTRGNFGPGFAPNSHANASPDD